VSTCKGEDKRKKNPNCKRLCPKRGKEKSPQRDGCESQARAAKTMEKGGKSFDFRKRLLAPGRNCLFPMFTLEKEKKTQPTQGRFGKEFREGEPSFLSQKKGSSTSR